MVKHLAASSYRVNSFNERPLILMILRIMSVILPLRRAAALVDANLENDDIQNDLTSENINPSFFERLKRVFMKNR